MEPAAGEQEARNKLPERTQAKRMLQARASLGKRSTLKRSQSVDGVTGPESGAHLASHPCDCRAACARCRVGRYCRFRDPFRVVWLGSPRHRFPIFPIFPISPHSLPSVLGWGAGKPRIGQSHPHSSSDSDWGASQQRLARCALDGRDAGFACGSQCHPRTGAQPAGVHPPGEPQRSSSTRAAQTCQSLTAGIDGLGIGACHRPGDEQGGSGEEAKEGRWP